MTATTRGGDFIRVRPTPAEIAKYRNKHKRNPTQYRVECKDCGTRIWGSGLGIGSHRRACKPRDEVLSHADVTAQWTSAHVGEWRRLLAAALDQIRREHRVRTEPAPELRQGG